MLISRNSCRRMAAGALGAGTVAGALLVGAAGPAQAAPEQALTPPPAAVQMAGTRADLPVAFGDRADTVFAATWHTAPMPQTTWAQHRHWWHHHHHFWHRWWWWWW